MAAKDTHGECSIALHRLKNALLALQLAAASHIRMSGEAQRGVSQAHSAPVIAQVLQEGRHSSSSCSHSRTAA
jgi:hypothetical protein